MTSFSDIHEIMERLDRLYETMDAPVITFLAAMDASPFKVLIATVLSLRTLDAVTARAAGALFAEADTPEKMVRIPVERIEQLIYPVGFYPTKARRIREIAGILLEKYGGRVPEDMDALLALPGVGRKTANLVLVEGFGIPAVCVDTHVHRISNRLGLVSTRTPEDTEMRLRECLPHEYWTRYNEILVAFGQTVCRPVSPFCSTCPLSGLCLKTGVTRMR